MNDLMTWLMGNIDEWRQYRSSNYDEKYKEYYRIWRGIWDEGDRHRSSERSRLISPATQQAVESTVAELEEATFGRDVWFDLEDDVLDPNKNDILYLRNLMKEDLEREGWKEAICETMLNGCLYGTGIAEILTEEKEELYAVEQPIEGTDLTERGVATRTYVCVKLKPVSPFNFSIDPAATTVDDAMGVAIDELVPRHLVVQGIKDGVYEDVDLGDASVSYEDQYSGETKQIPSENTIKLCKYYGKVPKHYLVDGEEDNDDMVEAIVVIANDSEIIKAAESPYLMQDRPVVAYQHDRVPRRFYGRGIVEKGYNAQKALDAELRARADALALTTHPMMAVDASRLPRGSKPKVRPGQTILTNGDPKTILMPFNYGQLNTVSYRESAELERMITMSTGAMDSAAPLGVNPRNATMGGMSMMMGASIKRQKRTLQNFQSSFLIPSLKKCASRFMQFDSQRYPVMDYRFKPHSTLGLMAREFETQQLIQLLQVTQPNSPVFMIILQSIYENSSIQNRELMVNALQQMLQQSQEPQRPQPNPVGMAQVEVQNKQADLKARKDAADVQLKSAELALKGEALRLKRDENEGKRSDSAQKNDIAELGLYLKSQIESGKMDSRMAEKILDRVS